MTAKVLSAILCSGLLTAAVILAALLTIPGSAAAHTGMTTMTQDPVQLAPVLTRLPVSLNSQLQPVGVAAPASLKPYERSYVVLGWNNLGMHCYNPDFSSLMILPPYNTLVAQVVRRGDPPQVVTSGVTVQYEFPENTYSVSRQGRPDKSNFWDYADAIFGVTLPPDVGLTGKSLAGTMDPDPDKARYVAAGIPLTEFRDQDAVNQKRYPFQKAEITVNDTSKKTLASLTVVAPVSTELSCGNCHSDTMDATTRYAPDVQPTGKIDTNILTLHDYLNRENYAVYLAGRPDLLAMTPLMENQPVMCAKCHGDNALNMPQVGTIKNLSNAIHGHHNPVNAPDITPDTAGCYNCHPGPETQCLRDTMSQNLSLQCTDCHGDITRVAQNPDPWLNEPTCSQAGCHGAGYETSDPLFQNSVGHGGMYCEACHDSTHAIAISREANDAIKFQELQGHTGTLTDCTVCHATKPTAMFNHTPK